MKRADVNIVALVPMKGHSQRVAGKNYRNFNGKPLFFWIIETLLQCPSINSVYIDTDSSVIKEKALYRFGDSIRIIDRPQHLLGDRVPMNDILLYDVSEVDADYYFQTHSTNPLLKKETIERAIELFLSSNKYDSLFSVTRIQSRLWDGNLRPVNHNPDRLEQTQDLPPIFEENSNIYIFTKDVISRRKNRIGNNPLMFEIPKCEAVDIDDEDDFCIAESLAKYYFNLRQEG